MVKFMILTQPRSGSAWFMTCLNSHPQIYCPKLPTLFSKRNLSPIKSFKPGFLQFDNPISPYCQYRSSSLGRQVAHFVHRKKLIEDFLTHMYSAKDNADAVGYKINYSQIRKYKFIYSWIKRNDVRIIQLVRYNLLKRLVSHQIANTRNLLHATESVEPIKVYIEPSVLIEDFERRKKRFARYEKRFTEDLKVPYLEISYESLLKNHKEEMNKTLRYLGVTDTFPLSSNLVKVNPDSIEEIVENYEEVMQALKNTEFDNYLT